jgi:hypothetical protein
MNSNHVLSHKRIDDYGPNHSVAGPIQLLLRGRMHMESQQSRGSRRDSGLLHVSRASFSYQGCDEFRRFEDGGVKDGAYCMDECDHP